MVLMTVDHRYEQLKSLGMDVAIVQPSEVSDYSSAEPSGRHLLVRPKTTEEVAVCLSEIRSESLSVYVRGAGTGTTGGAVPTQDGVILCLSDLNKVLEIDPVNQVAIVQSGVITGELQLACAKQGLFYPPDPASLETCTIGGNVAENAGGPRALKYGVTRDYVMGVSGYWVDGTPFSFGGKNRKDVSGYDLKHLLIGSEGTLGIVTEVTLKLLPQPRLRSYFHAGFESYDAALKALTISRSLGLDPSMVEFLDGRCLRASSAYLGQSFPAPITQAHLLIELDDFSKTQLTERSSQLRTVLSESAQSFQEIDSESLAETLMQFRRVTSLALKAQFPDKRSHDVTVPVSEIPELMSFLPGLGERYGMDVLGYGHLGDGNVHVNFLSHEPMGENFLKASQTLFENVLSLGGTLTGEHGIGLTKRDFLSLQFSESDRQLFRSIKQVFDPLGRLNPGKAI